MSVDVTPLDREKHKSGWSVVYMLTVFMYAAHSVKMTPVCVPAPTALTIAV